jgi:Transposase DDE domain group 1
VSRWPGSSGPGNAAAGATSDLVELVDLALAQLPTDERSVLVRSDSAGASTRPAWHLCEHQVGFSIGMQVDAHVREAIAAQPEHAWTPTVEPDGQARDDAGGVRADRLGGPGQLAGGHPLLCRREDAHPGAQLRFTDLDGHRFQVFVTDQSDPNLARLELRHRQRARVEDRIRAAKATGLRNLPFGRWRRNQVWLELVLTAQDLTGWARALLLDGELRVAEPKALRYRLWHVAARVVRHARRLILRLQASCPGRSSSPARSPACEPCRCAVDPAPTRPSAHPPVPGQSRLPATRHRGRATATTALAPTRPGRHLPATTPPARPAATTTGRPHLMESRGYITVVC